MNFYEEITAFFKRNDMVLTEDSAEKLLKKAGKDYSDKQIAERKAQAKEAIALFDKISKSYNSKYHLYGAISQEDRCQQGDIDKCIEGKQSFFSLGSWNIDKYLDEDEKNDKDLITDFYDIIKDFGKDLESKVKGYGIINVSENSDLTVSGSDDDLEYPDCSIITFRFRK